MSKGQRVVAVLLVAVAVLMVIDLTVGRADAQVETGGGATGACCLPDGACLQRWCP